MVSSSSRGPSVSFNAIKPDICAPGASVSAEVGSGTNMVAFGGTSGASPMVAGSAALLVQAYPRLSPTEIKALLMNTAETHIETDPVRSPGDLAPITRIGGGEVRVDRALNSKTAAWDADDLTGSLSFGYHAVSENRSFRKHVAVRNYSGAPRTYTISSQFRYSDDASSGAVHLEAPASLSVPANATGSFEVVLAWRQAMGTAGPRHGTTGAARTREQNHASVRGDPGTEDGLEVLVGEHGTSVSGRGAHLQLEG